MSRWELLVPEYALRLVGPLPLQYLGHDTEARAVSVSGSGLRGQIRTRKQSSTLASWIGVEVASLQR